MHQILEKTIKFVLDECFPPILRDCKLLLWLPFQIAFRAKKKYFFNFKKQVEFMSSSDIAEVYIQTSSVHIQHKGTDLNDKVIDEISSNIFGVRVLDVGCGAGWLANYLSRQYKVTACDILINPKVVNSFPEVHFKQASVEKLPFRDNEFDTVTCTHTLEHVPDIYKAIGELKRVAKQRVIVVLPKERPFLYTFNLHLHFFPYRYMVIQLFKSLGGELSYDIKEIEGCWVYKEDQELVSLNSSEQVEEI